MTIDLVAPARAGALVRLARPWFWPLGWGGAYLGSVLATGSLVPPAGSWSRCAAAVLVLGPLVWTAVLTVNDVCDLPTDRLNPRKATAPLVTGELTAADLIRWHGWSTVAALLAAASAGPAFLAGTVLVLALGYLYSVPPVRLKGRPGLDVATNALVAGVLAPLSGWTLHRPAHEFPPLFALLGILLVAALYLPTTVLDAPADRAAGVVTVAVRWRHAYGAGVFLWTLATVLWLTCLELGVFVRRESWWFQLAMAPVLLLMYAVAAKRPTIPRLAGVVTAFALPAADFVFALVSA